MVAVAEPLWNVKVDASKCAQKCYRESMCVSFFHNALTGACQGHSRIFNSHENLVPKPGFKYSLDGLYANNATYTDCTDIMTRFPSLKSGIYILKPDGQDQFQAYCVSSIGTWTLIQRRQDGSENFFRTWNEYKEGFGDLNGEFWLGNEKVWRVVKGRQFELKIKLWDFQDDTRMAHYQSFSIGSLAENYKLKISGFSGNAGDSMETSNGRAFSARDRDLDKNTGNCALKFKGAWWYDSCHKANLNGEYNNTNDAEGIVWYHWHGYLYSLKRTEMRIRPCC
ncbi:microfibril-associated glycoprotein 4-like isoform X2 [Haliotis rubra]|uniref:microfibril-associated glycoprotein 4-like isoform X2 n=1 Tax=Haliotis rubra TaxID=36100 RepID=UPI001EE53443|nr:microfibril-associated glycoprotein 4-like isoform X2 [Haliotis rubra]